MRAPDKTGIGASAWKIDLKPDRPDQTATLCSWLVHQPGVHVLWSYWALWLIHLRPIDGVRPTHKQYPEAEYEVAAYALDPDLPRDPDSLDVFVGHLTPADLVEQFNGVTDAQAITLCDGMVRAVMEGIMSLDSDYRSRWKEVIDKTLQHFVLGGHPQGAA